MTLYNPSFIVAEQSFQTSDVSASLKQAYWRDEVLSKIGSANIQRLDGCDFDSRIHLKVFSNELLIANTYYGSQCLYRSQKQLNSDDDGFFVLGTMLKGLINFEQRNKQQSATRTGIIFYYAQSPFDIVLQDCEDVLVRIPEKLLLDLLPTAQDIPAQILTCQNPYYHLLNQFIHTLYVLPSTTSFMQGLQIREALLQSLVAAISHQCDHTLPKHKQLDSYHYQKTLFFIKNHFQDETLDTQKIAKAVNLSPSHLQKIFAKLDSSIMQTVWQIRLEHAQKLLTPNQLSTYKLSISEVAYRSGFKNPSHFSRLFRKHTGKTPKEWVAFTKNNLTKH